MVRAENLHSKLALLRKYLGLLETLRSRSLGEIRADPFLQGALERYLFLAAQAAIDLAELLCVLKGLGRVESMSRGFGLLEESGILPHELAASMQKMVGFRNALAHGYENLNYEVVEEVLSVRLGELGKFGDLVEAAL